MSSPMIPASELAALQAVVSAASDQSCVIQRKHPVADGYGSVTDGYTTLATVAATVAQPSQQLMQNYDYLIGNLATWLVRLPAGQDVQRDDQLLIAGQTLRVQTVLAPRSYETGRRVLASELR